jgi:sugar lactone lactonase YvrE
MKTLGRILALLLLVFLAYALFWPVPIEPVAWTPPAAPALEGIYARNNRLAAVERISAGDANAPEAVAFDAQGRLYAAVENGRILRRASDDGAFEVFAETGGRPLGMRFDAAGNLIAADAFRGLLSIAPDGAVTTLATEHAGVPFRLTDDVDIAPDGVIYFSDASSKFPIDQFALDVLENSTNGRLLAYDPASRSTRLLTDGLQFANGVAVGPGGEYVLVTETGRYRVWRYWLAGPRAGTQDIFIENLPGFPDNITWNGRDTFWLALPSTRDPRQDALLPRPWLRKVAIRLRLHQLNLAQHAFVLGLDTNSRVVHNLQDDSPGCFAVITSAREHDGSLYLGTIQGKDIGRIPRP